MDFNTTTFMKRILISVLSVACAALFAGEIVFNEPFDSAEAVAKYSSDAKLAFEKGTGKEPGALKIEVPERARFGGLSLPIDVSGARGGVLELRGEVRGEGVAPGPQYFNGAKFMLVVNAPSGNVYGGPQMKTGDFGWQKIKMLVRVPHDAAGARLNLGLEQSFGKIYFRNVKIEKKSASLDFRKAANAGYADDVAGDGKGGWFDLGPEEDASKFNFRHTATFANVPYMALSPESNGGKSALLIKPAGSPKMGAESAKIPLGAPQEAEYLYVLNALETPERGAVGEIAVYGEGGKSHVFRLEGGADVACWKNVQKELKNAAVGAAWLAAKGYRKSNGLYSTRLKIPEGFGRIASVEFRKAKVPWIVAAATVSNEKFPFPSECKFITSANREWKAMPPLPDCGVIEGSALDCSSLWGVKEVRARVVASKDGRLELEDNPGVPVAFQTVADQGLTYNTLTATKESAEAYVRQLRIQGYNMVRFHYFDFALMGGAKEPLQFNEDLLERIDYYIYCLKKNGIYLNLDAMCSRYGFELGNTWQPDDSGRDYNFDLFFKESARKNWFEGVKKLLTRVNRYTNTRLVDDPVLAIVNGKNEQEFGLLGNPKKPGDMKPFWTDFLKRRYGGSLEKYNAAWNASAASWDDAEVYTDAQSYRTDAPARDIAAFKLEREAEMWKWFEKSLREIGYKGLCVNFDMLKSLRYASVRKDMPIVAMHSYHDHPSPSLGGVSSMRQHSSLSSANGVFRGIAGTAIWKKPLLITEYGHVFCNKYRYEQPFSIAAYAAMQGYGALTVHAQTVSIYGNAAKIIPFGCAHDPVNKVSEFIATHMLLRKDVSEAAPSVRVDYSTAEAFEKMSINWGIEGGLSKLALVARLSLLPDSSEPAGENEISLKSSGGSAVMTYPGYSVLVDSKDGFDTDAVVRQFKKRGLIPESNRTNAKNGVFESATGELYLDSGKNFMTVDTPRLQGMCAEAGGKCELSDFAVTRMGERGCAAAVSVDGRPLSESERVVVAYSTNALNTGMEFVDDSMRGVISRGGPPILYKTGKLSFRLKNRNARGFKLYALGMNGARVQELNTRADADCIRASIDTSKLKNGPAAFFELIAEK